MDESTEQFAVDLARRAGVIMREHFRSTNTSWKADNSPVTVADNAINQMVIDAVRAAYPDHVIIGEEQSFGEAADAEWAWVCDPIDGTLPFSHGIPTYVFSLGLAHFGKPVLGVLYDPIMERLVTARENNGAYLNGAPTYVSMHATLNRSVIDLPPIVSKFRKDLISVGGNGISLFSVAYASLLVATGEIAGVIYTNKFPWDGCAADVIVREAGGRLTSLHGATNIYNGPIDGFVASNGLIHDDLLSLIKEEFPDPV